ncbi:MAG: hypothetical protein AAFU64_03485, partial [Bacteroidota bacterium]
MVNVILEAPVVELTEFYINAGGGTINNVPNVKGVPVTFVAGNGTILPGTNFSHGGNPYGNDVLGVNAPLQNLFFTERFGGAPAA